MPEYNFINYVLNPIFLIPFGITAAFFAPLGYSVLRTWMTNDYKVKALQEQERAARQQRRMRRRANSVNHESSSRVDERSEPSKG